jgi:hypothetical protein
LAPFIGPEGSGRGADRRSTDTGDCFFNVLREWGGEATGQPFLGRKRDVGQVTFVALEGAYGGGATVSSASGCCAPAQGRG